MPFAATLVNGSAARGWTHQVPTLLLAKSTIVVPAGASVTRPAIDAVLSGPPAAIGGIVVSTTVGG